MAKKKTTKKKVVKKKTTKKSKVGKKTGKDRKIQEANLAPQWKKGESGNPKGYPKGRRNFITIYREAVVALAKKNKKSVKQLEGEMLQMGFKKARGGNYQFYKDILDRLHGKAVQPFGGVEDEPIKIIFDSAFARKRKKSK